MLADLTLNFKGKKTIIKSRVIFSKTHASSGLKLRFRIVEEEPKINLFKIN
jgi:hypothetical protein